MDISIDIFDNIREELIYNYPKHMLTEIEKELR